MVEKEMEFEGSDCSTIHEEVVNAIRPMLPEDESLMDLADTFKIFSDFTRVKILCALMRAEEHMVDHKDHGYECRPEMCVSDISVLLNMTKSSISHQLRILKQSNLVKYRKEGSVVYYSLADEHVKTIFNQGMAHVLE
ncbi:metalloregulator ArsR/SmtB family transcription factor [Fibrobacter sp. UWEL]|uniref:ArsR/SmtB family transcription factor n=1 Tax=Fibrobacter sp. UWEL TaxID=1896209 RepID=UPI000921D277|nr:metalloregulator ArsR/SmtB family transcription factor [Fibrobacter sp. UWEL]SHK46504.1 transcriptional regulator, ArsR family [Fibrobacter sp. UWEL]